MAALMVVKKVEMMVDPMAAMMGNMMVDQTVDWKDSVMVGWTVGLKVVSKVDHMVDLTGYY